MERAQRICPQLDSCQTVSLTRMFFPPVVSTQPSGGCRLSSWLAFEGEVVGHVPSSAASRVGRNAVEEGQRAL